jgi:hypothetical protein
MKKIATIGFLITALILVVPKIYAQVSVGISISARIAPPALPVYVQPPCPTDGYLWQPGYWAYDQNAADYYWVPGVWLAPPNPGLLWTPCYWGYIGGVYGFHTGYWGPHVGFYGGVNYGGGYGGVGFIGGGWQGNSFRYNTAVVNVNTTVVHNTYVDKTVINNTTVVNNRASFNGQGGVTAKPRPEELSAMNEQHVEPTNAQLTHQQTAMNDKSQFASVNHGTPATTAMNRVHGARFAPQGSRVNPQRNAAGAGRNPQPNADLNNKAENNNPGAVNNNRKANNAQQQQRMQQHNQQQQHKQQQRRAQPHANPHPAEEHEKHK